MAFSGQDGSDHSTLSEINVTPLVDVMLVLLTIFMIASSVETMEMQREAKELQLRSKEACEITTKTTQIVRAEESTLRQQHKIRHERMRMNTVQLNQDRLKELEEKLEDLSQNVPIELPKVNSEEVNLTEQQKIVFTLTKDLKFRIGDAGTMIDCEIGEDGKKFETSDLSFDDCLKRIKDKVAHNYKLQQDKECYLKADKDIPYGRVLAVMAAVREAGITKFGLVSDPEEGNTQQVE